MIQALLTKIQPHKKQSRSYAQVVSDEDRRVVVKLLKRAAQRANADQKRLIHSAK